MSMKKTQLITPKIAENHETRKITNSDLVFALNFTKYVNNESEEQLSVREKVTENDVSLFKF